MSKKAKTYNCQCIECGHEMTSETHCDKLKCPECGGQMRRKERPGPGQKSKTFSASNVKAVQDAITRRFGGMAGVDVREADGHIRITDKSPQSRQLQVKAEFAESEEAGEKLIGLSFSSELPVIGWTGEPEVLLHDAESANFDRLMSVGAILKNHDPNQIIGVPVRAWIDDKKRGNVSIRWGTTDDALKAKQEALVDKTLRGVSVGYAVHEWVYLKDKSETYRGISGPAWVAVRWSALEASLTPIPADPSVGLERSVRVCAPAQVVKQTRKGEGAMKKLKLLRAWKASDGKSYEAGVELDVDERTFAELTEGDEPQAAAVTDKRQVKVIEAPAPEGKEIKVDFQAEARAAFQAEFRAEAKRASDIRGVCKRFELSEMADELIAGGKTVEEAQRSVLDKLADRKPPAQGQVTLTQDGRDSFRSAAIDGILLRDGTVKIEKPASGANEMRGMSLLDLAKESLRNAGIKIPSDVRKLLDLAMGMRFGETISNQTSDFPYILAATAGKSLLAGFELAPATYPTWARVGSVNDFKAATRIKFSSVGKLKLVSEEAKYTDTARTESKETIQVGTYARRWTMSRQAVINDDLGAFTNTLFQFGMNAKMLPNDLAVAVLTANAAMTDTYDLFSTEHANNHAHTDYRLDTLDHAKTALIYLMNLLASQKQYVDVSEDAYYLGLRPKVWLVSQTDEIIARQVVHSASDVASSTNGGVLNAFANLGMTVVADQNIKTSGTDYSHYLFADPRLAPVVEVAFLQGNQQPFMEEKDQVDADGRVWLIRLDCGAAAVDYVGGAREVGTT
jgi:predicted RNA-binding Zn-ribbon protein involved in translation (DUF1610 family)